MSHGAAMRSAIAALRAGRAVTVDGEHALTIAAVETATPELLDLLDPAG